MRWELAMFLVGLVAIPIGCLLPNSRLPPLPNDKVLHFCAFGGMALLAGRLVHGHFQMGLALAAVFVASWLIELLQNWVPGRKFCWRDMAANAAGVLSAGICLAVLPPP
jgi:VanZ family protein